MKIGLVYPQTEYGSDPGAIKDYVQTAEDLGFSHVLAYDHVLGANPERPDRLQGPYNCEHTFQSPLLLFSYMAAVTQKLEFATGILILPQRQTSLVAKQAATLDVISGGRLRLGVGIGWNHVEYTALNENFHNRGARIEEQINVMRLLWSNPLVQFSGQWHSVPDTGINPLPVQRPIPIWFGGHADPVLKRMAHMGDGWMPNYRRVHDAKKSLEKIEQYLKEAKRSIKDFGLEARLVFGNGNPDEWKTIINEWQLAGATHISFNTMGFGFNTPKEHLAAIKKFSEAIQT